MTDSSDSSSTGPSRILDLTGLNCPLPVLKIKKALAEMAVEETLQARTTDPMSTIDITVFCERSGHEMVSATEHRDQSPEEFEFVIRKGGGS